MSKKSDVTRCTSPQQRQREVDGRRLEDRAAEGERRQGRADRDEQAEPDEQAGVEGRRLVELVAAAGQVAHDQREAGDEAPGEAAARAGCGRRRAGRARPRA